MAKSRFVRGRALEFSLAVLAALALAGCGTQTGAASGLNGRTTQATPARPFCVAPVDGSPEEAAFARGHCSSSSSYAAPIEGSPEQTAMELGR
jgi:hypothetical protein